MAILITGGTGFLGSHLTRYLLEVDGKKDIVLFDTIINTSRIADIQDRLTLVQGDVTKLTEGMELRTQRPNTEASGFQHGGGAQANGRLHGTLT